MPASLFLPNLPGEPAARLPLLLLPMNVQVKFTQTDQEGPELRVRIYPDQLSISTHEVALSEQELEAGRQYWQLAPQVVPGQLHDLTYWRPLVARFGAARARWILEQTTPRNLREIQNRPGTDPEFPEPKMQPDKLPWGQPARALALPEYFLVLLYDTVDKQEDLPKGPLTEQLFEAPRRSYDAKTITNPTTEFLRLVKVVQGEALSKEPVAVSFTPGADATTITPGGNPTGAGGLAAQVGSAGNAPVEVAGVDAGNHWTVDFTEAVKRGLGVRIPLEPQEYERGFRRLVVLGVRGQDEKLLAELLRDHSYTDGLAVLAQGTPTNNTDTVAAGYDSRAYADADATFALLTQVNEFASNIPWDKRTDGEHLLAALGLSDQAELPALPGMPGTDTRSALAMNQVLWPATYGYFLNEVLRPLLSAEALDWTRKLFKRYVLARGAVPALRVGRQPYGVLPTTRFSAWEEPDDKYAQQLQQVLAHLDVTWTERLNPQPDLYPAQLQAPGVEVAFEQPTEFNNLLATLGQEATSLGYHQRYLIGPTLTAALNSAAAQRGQSIWPAGSTRTAQLDSAKNPLYQEFVQLLDPTGTLNLPKEAPYLFSQTFQRTTAKLADPFADEPANRRKLGVLLDGQPLSETSPLQPLVGVIADYENQNFIHWLAKATFDEIRLEDFRPIIDEVSNDTIEGAKAFTAPNSLLYLLLRQAVLQQYWASAQSYLKEAGVEIKPEEAVDQELFNVLSDGETARWAWLYKDISGTPLHDILRNQDRGVQQQKSSLLQLASLPTAQLERLLAEHLDLGSYRLDAWRLAPVLERLHRLRQQNETATGLNLGAFGWLEDVVRTDRSVTDTTKVYDDPDNLGFIHAPSLAHGTTAAILRQGFKSRQFTADATDPASKRMAIDLSSRRVRVALTLLEGIQAGHALGTLLGQQVERALQQSADVSSTGLPYSSFVEALRAAFPQSDAQVLVTSQTSPQGVAPELVARQVFDGSALLRAAAQADYPYDTTKLPAEASEPGFALFLRQQVTTLTDHLDALGDLAVSEGVFQAARGNMDRATAILESVAKGEFPLHPEITQPPQRGTVLTHRVLLNLPASTTPANWPAQLTPRAQAAPRLNAWLAAFFPNPTQLELAARAVDTNGQPVLPLSQAGLQPLDLLYLLDEQALQPGSGFDRLLTTGLTRAAGTTSSSSDGGTNDQRAANTSDLLAVSYTSSGAQQLRRLLPLLARLRQLVGVARPARPADLQLPGTLADEDAGTDVVDLQERVVRARQQLQQVVTTLTSTTASTTNRRNACYTAALFGLAEAVAALTSGTNLAVAGPLVQQAASARLAAAGPATAATRAELLQAVAALFGDGFRPDVGFSLSGAAKRAYETAATPAAAAQLLHDYVNQPWVLQEWLHGVAAVREPLQHLDKVFLIQGLLHPDSSPTLPLQPAQLLATPDAAAPWLGLPWPAAYTPPGGAVSLVQWLPAGYQPAQTQCALWLDEWTETLPEATHTSALTFHYDQPNSAAPQTMLLVVPPRADTRGSWKTEDVVGAINETLDLAKKRTVDPDALAATHLATVLPGTIAPVAQQAVTFTLDLGRLNGTARFREQGLTL